MNGERSWVIPWMEDDLSLASAELWVNRTLEHADKAHRYEAEGLLGLMWRTWETAPQIHALAKAGWTEAGASPLTDHSVYQDFCRTNFGRGTADRCAELFLGVDSFNSASNATCSGSPTPLQCSKLPRDGQGCCGGCVCHFMCYSELLCMCTILYQRAQ